MTSAVPIDHPAHVLGTFDDDDSDAYLDVHVFGGSRPMDCPSLRHWHAEVSVRRDSDIPFHVLVATMRMTVVNEFLGDPVSELDALSSDGEAFGSALWHGSDRSEAFMDIAEDVGTSVLLIDTYTLEPDWRGTPLTPLIALRVLDVFAHLGISAAALYAAPMSNDLTETQRARVADRIAAMWKRAGFIRLTPEDKVMAMSFDSETVRDAIRELAGDDPLLSTVIER